MGRKYRGLILVAPIFIIYTTLILGGLYKMFVESLGYIPYLSMTTISLHHYQEVLLKKDFMIDFLYSLYLAYSSTIISLVFGVAISFQLIRTKNKFIKAAVTKVMELGVVLPYLYMLFIVVLMFSRTGIISRVLYHLKLIDGFDQFPVLLNVSHGLGIILVFILKGTPFVTLFVLNVMNNVSNSYEDVARNLGASPSVTLFKVYIPLCKDGIVWSFMVLLAYDLGSFEVPYLLSSLYPKSLSVRLFSSYIDPNISRIPEAMAMSMIVFVLGILIVGLSAFILRKVIGGKY